MRVAESGTLRSRVCEFERNWYSMKGTKSCDILVSKGFVDSSKWDRVIMEKLRAFNQVVPDFGALLKITLLG